MRVDSAVDLVNGIVYRPGWTITAKPHTARFEGAICVRIEYPAQNTDRDQAPDYPTPIQTRATFPLIVSECDDVALYRQVMDAIMEIEEHEAREYFRVEPTHWAPFHPHRVEGMNRWGNPQRDLRFGLA
jgi:hypothetical protein